MRLLLYICVILILCLAIFTFIVTLKNYKEKYLIMKNLGIFPLNILPINLRVKRLNDDEEDEDGSMKYTTTRYKHSERSKNDAPDSQDE